MLTLPVKSVEALTHIHIGFLRPVITWLLVESFSLLLKIMSESDDDNDEEELFFACEDGDAKWLIEILETDGGVDNIGMS